MSCVRDYAVLGAEYGILACASWMLFPDLVLFRNAFQAATEGSGLPMSAWLLRRFLPYSRAFRRQIALRVDAPFHGGHSLFMVFNHIVRIILFVKVLAITVLMSKKPNELASNVHAEPNRQ